MVRIKSKVHHWIAGEKSYNFCYSYFFLWWRFLKLSRRPGTFDTPYIRMCMFFYKQKYVVLQVLIIFYFLCWYLPLKLNKEENETLEIKIG